METTNTSEHNPEARKVIDEHLEPIVQDFEEFRERMAQSSKGAMKLEDIVDLYIDNTCANSDNQSHTSQDQFTTLLQDFIDFTPTSPHQAEPTHDQSTANSVGMEEENQTVNLNSVDGVTYIRYGDLNYDGAAGEFISRVFGSEMNFWWRGLCGTARGKRVKRKYKWVMESEEEETAHSTEKKKKTVKREKQADRQ